MLKFLVTLALCAAGASYAGEVVTLSPTGTGKCMGTVCEAIAASDPAVAVNYVSVYQPWTTQHSMSVEINGKLYGARVPFTAVNQGCVVTPYNNLCSIDYTATDATLFNASTAYPPQAGDGTYLIATITVRITTIYSKFCSGRGCGPHQFDTFVGGTVELP